MRSSALMIIGCDNLFDDKLFWLAFFAEKLRPRGEALDMIINDEYATKVS